MTYVHGYLGVWSIIKGVVVLSHCITHHGSGGTGALCQILWKVGVAAAAGDGHSGGGVEGKRTLEAYW